MQTGEFIVHREMVGIIRDICKERGIEFAGYSDDWLLELKKANKKWRVLGYKFSLNDAVSSSIAGDKVATHILLESVGIPSVKHELLRPKITDKQKESLLSWDKIVMKPLDGSGGHGVRLFNQVDYAIEWIESTGHPAWAASPFLDIVREIRFVLLDQKPLIVYEKQPVLIDGMKMFNLGLGATPKDIEPDTKLIHLAAQAQAALGLRLSAVDVIETTEGESLILEINSGFMMEHYIRYSPEHKARAINAYRKIIDAVISS